MKASNFYCYEHFDGLGLVSYEIRRNSADIILIYGLINHNIHFPELLFQIGLYVPVHFTRYLFFFFVLKCITNLAV
jgi:hypothetical protein